MPSFNCRHPTCPALLPARGYCARHQHLAPQEKAERNRDYDQHRRDKDAKRFYDSAAWQRARADKLGANPICERCGREFAAEVHHVIPLRQCDDEQRTDPSNLQSLCGGCHKRIEGMRRRRGNGGAWS